jgi:hypothetical protein
MPHYTEGRQSLPARLLSLLAACYPPLVLGLGIFFLVLLCCQTAPPEYQAESIILRTTADDAFRSDDLEGWLISDSVLRAALMSAEWPQLAESSVAADSQNLIADLRERIVLTPLHQPDESPRLAISCTASRGAVAKELAGELAHQVVGHFESQQIEQARRLTERSLVQAQERLRLARDAEERQREILERLRHSQLAMAAANPRAVNPPAGGETLNPRWVELKTQLDTLQSQRAEMLEILTETHPEIAGLDLRIAKVSGSLGKTPRLLATPIEPISSVHNHPSNRQTLLEWRRNSPIAQQQFEQPLPESTNSRQGLDPFLNLAAQIDEATHRLSLVNGQRKGLEGDVATLEHELGEPPAPTSWTTETARRVAKIGGGYAAEQVQWAQRFAVATAGLTLLMVWRARLGKRLHSLADVLIHVRLPLKGAVVLAPQPELSSVWRWGTTPLRLAMRCSEALLLGILATCLAMSWIDPSLGSEFALDPLGAFAETAKRIL